MSNAGKGKPNRIAGIRMTPSNGDSSSNIPPDLEWDAENPPFAYECSDYTEHIPGCPGCDGKFYDESEVTLSNEAKAWARAGMVFKGSPDSMMNLPFVGGIPVEIYSLEKKFEVLMQVIIEAGLITQEDLDIKYRLHKAAMLKRIREANEDRVKKERTAQQLGIPTRLIGPDGQPLI